MSSRNNTHTFVRTQNFLKTNSRQRTYERPSKFVTIAKHKRLVGWLDGRQKKKLTKRCWKRTEKKANLRTKTCKKPAANQQTAEKKKREKRVFSLPIFRYNFV